MLPRETLEEAARVLEACRRRGWRLATAESCTGGLIAAALTHVAGSSDVFDRGFVTYANEAKTELLGVSSALIEVHGAVSQPVASAMAAGALARSMAELTISVTGIAGPGGGSADKPVGLVWFGCAGPTFLFHASNVFAGNRETIRAQAVSFALGMLTSTIARSS